MKQNLFAIIIIFLTASCASLSTPRLGKLIEQVELGSTKQEVINILGNNYVIDAVSEIEEGKLEVLLFTSSYSYDYLFYFVNNHLTEFHRYIPPQTVETADINGSRPKKITIKSKEKDTFEEITSYLEDAEIKDEKGNKRTIRKDIFGDLEISDDRGNKKTIKKDILGDVTIEDSKGNKKTVKKDIFGNIEIKDNKGNTTTVKKDILGNIEIIDDKGNKKTVKKNIFGDIEIE
ncbi:hypothetical protein [Dysgonomonas sp. Marseille-P4361]|uniref:hypothetical protein n=1 Tax=Dysgonomonas sp. Marseille-P4361 TaxID=2161820 RepID=UPI00135B762E|nr:hypothetical protein [Dysgonomonas sp. Marseille-P4361]